MRTALLALLAVLVVPTVARADDFIVGSDVTNGKSSTAAATLTGALTVTFKSDPAACAAAGRCGLDGTISWRPQRQALFTLLESRHRLDAYLFSSGTEQGGLVTSARVQRTGDAGGGLCADGDTGLNLLEFGAEPGAVTFGLGSGDDSPDLLATRCAGPLFSDVRGLLPRRRVAAATLRRGPVDIDLSGEAPFAAAGFIGTVRSDVRLHIAQLRRSRQGRLPASIRKRIRRQRYLEADYRVERITGTVGVDLRGAADAAACAPLDVCGLSGTQVLTPRGAGTVSFSASASAKRPRQVLERALGLTRGKAPAGIETYGAGVLQGRGDDQMSIGRAGATPCTDRVALKAVALLLEPGATTVHASLVPYGEGSGPLRTRCPGVTLPQALATGELPRAALRHTRITLRLTRGATFGGDGLTARSHPDVTIVLRRTRVRERIIRVPSFGPAGG